MTARDHYYISKTVVGGYELGVAKTKVGGAAAHQLNRKLRPWARVNLTLAGMGVDATTLVFFEDNTRTDRPIVTKLGIGMYVPT